MNARHALLAGLLVVGAGCYHAVVDTGLTPGTQVIEKPWATGFVYGLVPPSPVSAMATCRSGVARVETKHSFLNGLVGGLTFGIFTPMTIKVTCAGGPARGALPGEALDLGPNATPEQAQAVLDEAVRRALETGSPAFIRFE